MITFDHSLAILTLEAARPKPKRCENCSAAGVGPEEPCCNQPVVVGDGFEPVPFQRAVVRNSLLRQNLEPNGNLQQCLFELSR